MDFDKLWRKIRCSFGYHMWWEQWPKDWPMKSVGYPFFSQQAPRMETPEDHEKKGWTRKCLDCGKVQKREEW